MKANEAPEKIYLTTFGFPICEPIPQDSSNPDTVWSEKPYVGADSIEYIRTDVLVRKACEYLRNTKRCVVECIGENVYKPLLSEEEIMEFCKSMKGE